MPYACVSTTPLVPQLLGPWLSELLLLVPQLLALTLSQLQWSLEFGDLSSTSLRTSASVAQPVVSPM